MLKAIILSCEDSGYWYADKIGESFEVFEQSRLLPYSSVFNIEGKAMIIANADVLFFTENENGGKKDGQMAASR